MGFMYGIGQVAGFCECDIEPSAFTECGNISEQFTTC